MALFDFKFRRFITPTVIGVIYALELIAITIGVVVFIAGQGGSYYGAFGNVAVRVVVGIVGWFVLIVLLRVVNEGLVALTRIAENTSEILEELRNRGSGPLA